MTTEKATLPLKYRPENFDDFFGNDAMIESLKSVINRNSGPPHCILFQGPSGCGKTTLARIFSKQIDCDDNEFYEYNISQMRGIDTAREIIKNAGFLPLAGKKKIYVLNECHKATPEFQNAMLEILEEPPAHVYFVLCTTEPGKLLPTIREQRASVFAVSSLPIPLIIKLLKSICEKEGVKFPNEHIKEIADCSEGSPRKALTILDKIIDIEDDNDAFDAIYSASFDQRNVKEIIDLLMSGKKNKWKEMVKLIKGIDMTSDTPEKIRYSIKGYFGAVFLNTGNPKHHDIMALFLEPFFYSGKEGLIDALYLACEI